jgi:hypothetical protein
MNLQFDPNFRNFTFFFFFFFFFFSLVYYYVSPLYKTKERLWMWQPPSVHCWAFPCDPTATSFNSPCTGRIRLLRDWLFLYCWFFQFVFCCCFLYCCFLLVINPFLFDLLLGKKLRPDQWVVDVNVILTFGSRRKSHS